MFSPRTLSLSLLAFLLAATTGPLALADDGEPGDEAADSDADEATANSEAAWAPPAWTVQVDPLTTALGFVHVQIERRLAKKFSIYAGPHARLFRGILAEEEEDQTGFGVEVGARWFIRSCDHAPAGLWAQARGVIARVSKDGESEPGGYVSALAGYTYIIGGRWVLAGGLGIQYIHYSVNGVGTEGVLPAAHTTVGVAF